MHWRFACVALTAVLGWAQRPSDKETAALIERSRTAAIEYSKSLPDFMCTEVVHRFVDPTHRDLWRISDILSIKLSFSQLREDHQLILVNGKLAPRDFNAIGGATTVGEFGTSLIQIFDPRVQAAFVWEKWTRMEKRPAAEYRYRVTPANSRYSLVYGDPGKRQELLVGFHGVVTVDRETGEVLHYSYVADDIPKDFAIRFAQTSVTYDMAEIGGMEFLMPVSSETEMKSSQLWTRNKSEFREYRKFSTESTLTFGPDKER